MELDRVSGWLQNVVTAKLTPMRYGVHPWKATNSDGEYDAEG